jgi:hypothetical protein
VLEVQRLYQQAIDHHQTGAFALTAVQDAATGA